MLACVVVCVPSPQSHIKPVVPLTEAKNVTNNPVVEEEPMLKVKLALNAAQVETVSVNVYVLLQESKQVSVTVNVPILA